MKFVNALVATLIAAGFSWSAQKVYAPSLELIGVGPKYQYSTLRLLKTYVDEQGDYELLLGERNDTLTTAPSKEEALAQAREAGAGLLLMGELNAVGDKMIVSFRLIDVAQGEVVWSDRLKASNPEDLDPIMMRIGKAMGTGKKAADSDDIYSVTFEETKTLKQKRANRSFGLAIGGLGLPNTPFDGVYFVPTLEAFASYDARDFIAEIRGGYLMKTDPYGMHMGINVYRPLSDEASAPYIGGGIGFGFLATEDMQTCETDYYGYKDCQQEFKSGPLVSLGGGYMFSRTSTLQLKLNATYWIYAFRVNDMIPHGAKLTLDMSWNR